MKDPRAEVESLAGRMTDAQWAWLEREVEDEAAHGIELATSELVELLKADRRTAAKGEPRSVETPHTGTALEARAEALGAFVRREVAARPEVRSWRRRGVPRPDDLDDFERGLPDPLRRRLEQIVAKVADQYALTKADARLVVACDVPRPVYPVLVSARIRAGTGPFILNRAVFERVVLEVDPMVTPEQLRDTYRQVRSVIFPGRRRVMGLRQLRLASFMATRNGSTSYAADAVAWARSQPGAGRVVRPDPNFARNARRAVWLLFGMKA